MRTDETKRIKKNNHTQSGGILNRFRRKGLEEQHNLNDSTSRRGPLMVVSAPHIRFNRRNSNISIDGCEEKKDDIERDESEQSITEQKNTHAQLGRILDLFRRSGLPEQTGNPNDSTTSWSSSSSVGPMMAVSAPQRTFNRRNTTAT